VDEFYLSDAKHTAADLVEMGEMATKELKALAWCYTFDFR